MRTRRWDVTRGLVRAVAVAICILLGAAPTRAVGQDQSVRAAAKLTGITSGMAQACGYDPKPVLHAFRDLLDRKRILGKERTRLVRLVSAASDRGMADQQQPGAMSCPEVKSQMARTIRRLRRAK
jgi:hypothetical protein